MGLRVEDSFAAACGTHAKKTLFIDMDNVLVKFQLGIDQLNETEKYLECIYVFCNFAA